MTAESTGGSPGLYFGMLGPLVVHRDGLRQPLGGRQQRVVLAVLLCENGHAVGVDRIADAIWGEDLPAGFVPTVQNYVFHLRAVLEPDRARGSAAHVLTTEPGGNYCLNVGNQSVDAHLFEDLVRRGRSAAEAGDPAQAISVFDQALDLWRGEVLADLVEFDFVDPISARLQELRLSTLEARIDAEVALGHHDLAAAELDRLIAEHPLRERLHAQRMLALYRSDRQSEALAAYRGLRALLRDELGVEPGPAVQELHSRVLAHDPTLTWYPPVSRIPIATAAAATSSAIPVRTSSAVAAPVSERTHPLVSRIRSLPRRTVAACTAVVLLAAGGTTALLAARTVPAATLVLPAGSLGAIRPDGSVAASIPVGDDSAGVAYGEGALWVADRGEGRVRKIDPASRTVVQTLDVGASPEAVTVWAGAVWVANFADDTVSRISVVANQVVQTISVGTGPSAIASGPSGVWVANSADDTVQRIDPESGKAQASVAVGAGPDGIAVDGRSLWVANGRDGTVSHVDADLGEAISGPIPVGTGPRGIAVYGGSVWVADQLDQTVTRIDRITLRTQSILVGDGPRSVVVSHGSVWVGEEYRGVLDRIDPKTMTAKQFSVGSSPRGLAALSDRVWVAGAALSEPTHRGGTLTVTAKFNPGHFGGIDPASAFTPDIGRAERAVYDGLVAFRMASGADSQVLVPDLATAIPRASDGGRTYTFTIRRGVRYSTGAEVRASDFRLGVQRALYSRSGNPTFFTGIIGGQNCHDHPARCDLSRGIEADDAAARVTFHLRAPDPGFLYKLSYLVRPVPPGTQVKPTGDVPLPATGPYMITAYQPDQTFVLGRNPYFRQWSFEAQPAGYPDVIRWLVAAKGHPVQDEVIAGRADLAQLSAPSSAAAARALVDSLKARYPLQLNTQVLTATDYLTIGTTVPPFSRLLARQALSFALDRNELASLFGGPAFVVPTCQLLPPRFPGYAWYCPYTPGTPDGTYHGPDLTRAVKLAHASGTWGQSVTFYSFAGANTSAVNSYLAGVLRSIGYRPQVRVLPPDPSSADYLTRERTHTQLFWGAGWVADYPLASDFYDNIVACGVTLHYCSHVLDRQARVAAADEGTDPGTALRTWTKIDRQVTDLLPVIPIDNNTVTFMTSPRVRNYQSNALEGPLLSQLWVQ
jgi:YVTN family beta-propeller protein